MVFRYGWDIISTYMYFPFLPTLITLYLISSPVSLPWHYLLPICFMKGLGYIMYRCMYFLFLPTLTTLYLINNPVSLPWHYLLPICFMKGLGYF
jgi:hypothetical protein